MNNFGTKTITGARIKKETEKAYLIEKGGKEVWIPKSQIKAMDMANPTKDQRGRIVNTELVFLELPTWLADKDNIKELA